MDIDRYRSVSQGNISRQQSGRTHGTSYWDSYSSVVPHGFGSDSRLRSFESSIVVIIG